MPLTCCMRWLASQAPPCCVSASGRRGSVFRLKTEVLIWRRWAPAACRCRCSCCCWNSRELGKLCESSDRSKCDEFKPDDMLPERKCEGDGEMFDQCSKLAPFAKCCCVANAQKERESESEREGRQGRNGKDETRRYTLMWGTRDKSEIG